MIPKILILIALVALTFGQLHEQKGSTNQFKTHKYQKIIEQISQDDDEINVKIIESETISQQKQLQTQKQENFNKNHEIIEELSQDNQVLNAKQNNQNPQTSQASQIQNQKMQQPMKNNPFETSLSNKKDQTQSISEKASSETILPSNKEPRTQQKKLQTETNPFDISDEIVQKQPTYNPFNRHGSSKGSIQQFLSSQERQKTNNKHGNKDKKKYHSQPKHKEQNEKNPNDLLFDVDFLFYAVLVCFIGILALTACKKCLPRSYRARNKNQIQKKKNKLTKDMTQDPIDKAIKFHEQQIQKLKNKLNLNGQNYEMESY